MPGNWPTFPKIAGEVARTAENDPTPKPQSARVKCSEKARFLKCTSR